MFQLFCLLIVLFIGLALRKADLDQCDETDEQTAPAGRGFSAKLSTSAAKPQKWAILDGLWLILSSTYLLYVSLFLWLNAVVSSFFYFQVRVYYLFNMCQCHYFLVDSFNFILFQSHFSVSQTF